MFMDGKWLNDHLLMESHTPNLEMLSHLKNTLHWLTMKLTTHSFLLQIFIKVSPKDQAKASKF